MRREALDSPPYCFGGLISIKTSFKAVGGGNDFHFFPLDPLIDSVMSTFSSLKKSPVSAWQCGTFAATRQITLF
jgi:hypothetical protein